MPLCASKEQVPQLGIQPGRHKNAKATVKKLVHEVIRRTDSSEAAGGQQAGCATAAELHHAAKQGDAAAIAALLESGADPDGDVLQSAADDGDGHGWTPLHEVAARGGRAAGVAYGQQRSRSRSRKADVVRE